MTARAALLALLALLAVAASAPAKGITKVVVCGADGCSDVTTRAHGTALVELGAETDGVTARGPGFVRVKVTIGNGGAEHFTVKQLYVPARGIVATREEGGGWVWTEPLPDAVGQLRDLARGVRTFPARRLPAAARLTDPAPAVVARAPAPAVERAGAGGGVPAWAWAFGGLVVLAAAFAARRRGRA